MADPLDGRWYYGDTISNFLAREADFVLGHLVLNTGFAVDIEQRRAWVAQVEILQSALTQLDEAGHIYFEFAVPRLGKRIDAVVAIRHLVFVIEFKVGETQFTAAARDQVWDYALDLKYFHKTSHHACLVPLLIASDAAATRIEFGLSLRDDDVIRPINVGRGQACEVLRAALDTLSGTSLGDDWATGRYSPTPTIVEAAVALYAGHSVEQISRSDAGAINLSMTARAVDSVIHDARNRRRKAICFVTGVPGAGKTLVGLDVAHRHMDPSSELYSVYLSGNGPLVAVLQEALARNELQVRRSRGEPATKKDLKRRVRAFIQNVHQFRDEYLNDQAAPSDHVALFDEAQRAWNLQQTRSFMKRKKGRENFPMSEPAFLISCMDRHEDWAVIVCLVGSGQEINTGEGGIAEWLVAVAGQFPHWDIHVPPQLRAPQYGARQLLDEADERGSLQLDETLHLAVSMRSFRAESLSDFVRLVLDLEIDSARDLLKRLLADYPIALTRCPEIGREWVRTHARGTERYGVVVSSQAYRLKPHAIDVRVPVDPVHWFLGGKSDVRSSYYLEDVATEFQVQGLEVDWACLVWDGDLRFSPDGWSHNEFRGTRWQRIKSEDRQRYQTNAYRVLMTRARQGLVIVVPNGDPADPTRSAAYYDPTFEYLKSLGLPIVS